MLALDIPKNVEIFRQRDVRETTTKTQVTKYWSVPGSAFQPTAEGELFDRAGIPSLAGNGGALAAAWLPVTLPHGAVVTAVKVWGSDAADTWALYWTTLGTTGGASAMASNTMGNEDTTITDPAINNQTRCYWIETSAIANTESVDGAMITYTILE